MDATADTTARLTPDGRTRGVVYLHACPPAIAPHVEWALATVLDCDVRLSWSGQPASTGQLRAEASWSGPIGTAGRIATALRGWPMVAYEITEDPTSLSDGERLAHLPGRGVHRRTTAANGDVTVGEERLRGLLERANTVEDFRHGLSELLGIAWDAELEPLRLAGDGAEVRLLHQVG